MKEINIDTEYINLGQFLKWASVAESGFHAKEIIQEGLIKVNDDIEIRRGRKLYPGDRILVEDKASFLIVKKG